jgi:hypothetical protein
MQLDSFDPTSEHFRYPIRKDGSETLTTLSRLYMPRFHEAMEGVAALLDAADTGLRVMTEQCIEIEESSSR